MKGEIAMEFQNFLDTLDEKTISVKDAAQMMGKSEQFIRVGLRRQRLPFGVAVQITSQWSYYISPKLFYEYIGYEPEKQHKKSLFKKIFKKEVLKEN